MSFVKFKKERERELVKEKLKNLPKEEIDKWLKWNWEEVSVEFGENLRKFFKEELEHYLWEKYMEVKNERY